MRLHTESSRLALVAFACLLLSGVQARAGDCNFSQQHQIEVLNNALQSRPGGVLVEANREVSWALPGGGSLVFGYGGCLQLGSVVYRSVPAPAPLEQDQVIAAALELARQFWGARVTGDVLALETLSAGLESGDFTLELVRDKSFINVRHPAFSQLYVEHSYSDGFDQVGITWQAAEGATAP